MKLVVQVKLLPTPVQAAALEATLHACNEAATWASEVAFTRDVKRNFALRRHTYTEIKHRWGLGAQAAQHAIKKTCDAYTTLKANARAGNLGKPWSRRYRRAVEKPIVFRPEGAQPYDDRMLSWQSGDRTVSIWTLSGRIKGVAFTASPEQLARLALYRKGESDLFARDGMWFLNATCEIPETEPNTDPDGFLGIDLGIVNLATTSDGEIMAGRELNRARAREGTLRTKLQKKNTPSAKRRLKKRRRKESRRAKDINHKIAKHVVAEAERTSRGIALEDLTGIRERVRLRKPQRATHFPVNPKGPAAQGDRTVVRSKLYAKEDEKKQIGWTHGTCTTTLARYNGGVEECVVTYVLPGGQLTVQGLVFGILTNGQPTLPPPSFDNAITGGTGKFDRARGQVHADTIGPGKRRFTIDLDR
ncbi:transposase [Streptomyces sp. NPDC051453]|uniref:transposase n=1 Tax=Streptomyces sp. NPDC051453 TaxID=3154941 RepID=UPI003416C483